MDTESQDLESFRGIGAGNKINVKDIKLHQRTSSEEIVDTSRFQKKTPNQGLIKGNTSALVNAEFKD